MPQGQYSSGMKTFALILLLALADPSAVTAQVFSDFPGLSEDLAALRVQADALRVNLMPPKEVQKDSAKETPDVSAYPVRGIDISRYQGAIDWKKVQGAGLSFVFIQATNGKTFVDPSFKSNWAGASTAGLAKGAYHFYNFCDKGAAQADNFIKSVPKEAENLPMVIDLEQSKTCKKMPAKAAFQKDFAAFVAKVKKAYGLTPILYINHSIYEQYLVGLGGDYKLWISDPRHKSPDMPDGQSWTFWQYSFEGKIAGIDAGVDLDVFDGDPQTLASLGRPSSLLYASLR